MSFWHQVLSDQNSKAPLDETSGSVLNVLQRESYVLLGGSADGIKAAAERALETPMETGGKLLGSAAMGGAFAYLQARPGMLGLSGRIVGGALAVSFLVDCAGRLATTGSALADSARSSENLDANRAIVAGTVGPFVVDTAIMSAGGIGGALAAKPWVPSSSALRPSQALLETVSQEIGVAPEGAKAAAVAVPKAEVPLSARKLFDVETIEAAGAVSKDMYWNTWPSVIKVSRAGKSSAGTGTGFVLSEDGLAVTNYHVVANGDMIAVHSADGRLMKAQVVKVDPGADLALLKIDTRGSKLVDGKRVFANDKLDPVKLAGGSDASYLGSTVYAFGHNPSLKEMAVAVGTLDKLKTSPSFNGSVAPLNPRLAVFEGNAVTKKGFSGGPVVNEQGEVVAVSFASNQEGLTLSVPVSALKQLIGNRPDYRSAEFWSGIVPLLKQAGRSPAPESTDLSAVYAAARESIFKVRAIKGGKPEVASGFLVSDSGHVITSSKLVEGSTEVTINKNGVWSVPMQVESQLGEGMVLLKPDAFMRHHLNGRPFQLAVHEAGLATGQRVTAFGFPRDLLELHASVGDFAGYVRKAPHFALGLGMTVDEGFAGAPVLNRVGRVVGVSLGGDSSKTVSFGTQARVMAERLKGLGIAVESGSVR